jgi:hypothetical protein
MVNGKTAKVAQFFFKLFTRQRRSASDPGFAGFFS